MGQVRKLPEKAPGHKTLLSEMNDGGSVLIMSPPVPPHGLPQTQQQQTPLSYYPGLSSLVALPRFILFLLPRGVSTWCGPQALAGLTPQQGPPRSTSSSVESVSVPEYDSSGKSGFGLSQLGVSNNLWPTWAKRHADRESLEETVSPSRCALCRGEL